MDVHSCSAPTVGFTAHFKIRDLSTSRQRNLTVFGARMFPHCLFEHRLRTRNTKEANQQAWEALREITQRRGIYKKTSFAPS